MEPHYSISLLDPRDPLFTGILLRLHGARQPLAASTIAADLTAFDEDQVTAALDLMTEEAATILGPLTSSGNRRWSLADWGRDWARIAVERKAREDRRARGRSYHYGTARGDGNPSQEYWCDWCAGFYGVPHDIVDPGEWRGTHRVGELCRNARRSQHYCACIDCATLRNDRTILTHEATDGH